MALKRRKTITVTPYVESVVATTAEFIRQNIHRRSLAVADLATAVDISTFNLHRYFKAATGITIKAAIVARQLELAKENLLGGMPPEAVARASGFASQAHFNQRFRKFVGQTPMAWLKSESVRHGASLPSTLPADWPQWCDVRTLAARWGISCWVIQRLYHTDGLGTMIDNLIMIRRDEVEEAERRAALFPKFRYVRRTVGPGRDRPPKETS